METFQFDFEKCLVPNPYCCVMHLLNNSMLLVVQPFCILEFKVYTKVLGIRPKPNFHQTQTAAKALTGWRKKLTTNKMRQKVSTWLILFCLWSSYRFSFSVDSNMPRFLGLRMSIFHWRVKTPVVIIDILFEFAFRIERGLDFKVNFDLKGSIWPLSKRIRLLKWPITPVPYRFDD